MCLPQLCPLNFQAEWLQILTQISSCPRVVPSDKESRRGIGRRCIFGAFSFFQVLILLQFLPVCLNSSAFKSLFFMFHPEFIIIICRRIGLILLEAELCSVFYNVFVLLMLIISNEYNVRDSPINTQINLRWNFFFAICPVLSLNLSSLLMCL